MLLRAHQSSSLTGPYVSRGCARCVSILVSWFSACLCTGRTLVSARTRSGRYGGDVVIFVFVFHSFRHRLQVYAESSAYVYMALLRCNCACNSFSSSIVGIASWVIASYDAILRDSLVRYPLELIFIPLARIKSSNSFIGSFPVHNLSDGFLGKGAFNVSLPAFVPVLIYQVFRKRLWARCLCFCSGVAVS
jgi:hypothetical protein